MCINYMPFLSLHTTTKRLHVVDKKGGNELLSTLFDIRNKAAQS